MMLSHAQNLKVFSDYSPEVEQFFKRVWDSLELTFTIPCYSAPSNRSVLIESRYLQRTILIVLMSGY